MKSVVIGKSVENTTRPNGSSTTLLCLEASLVGPVRKRIVLAARFGDLPNRPNP
jgi:hypothetical protein